MELRRKFGLLALIFLVSLCTNLVMSGWCIIVYFRSAFIESETDFAAEQQLAMLRTLVRQRMGLLGGPDVLADQDVQSFARNVRSGLARMEEQGLAEALADLWPRIQTAAQRVEAPPEVNRGNPAGTEPRAALIELERLLAKGVMALGQRRQAHVERAAEVQQRVVQILVVNTAVGALLCAAGLLFFRRWVTQPVADLRKATQEFAQGNLSFRTRPRSSDELGRLAQEVNLMAATIQEMQSRLVESERLAAAGEMVTRLTHNMRNPLVSIRWLAEAVRDREESDPETAECLRRLIRTVDRLEKWFHDLQQTVTPLTLEPQRIRIAGLIDDVTAVLQPMMDRHQVQMRAEVNGGIEHCDVIVDRGHMEQALVALLTNAVQASQPGQEVRIRVERTDGTAGRWQLAVEDDGEGIPPEIRDKIFAPYFTTKQDGSGIGLPIASKVIKAHGGDLTVESEPGRGSRFVASLPGLI